MNPSCTTYDLTHHADRLDFFQQMILNGLRYWQEHPAIQTIDAAVLDRERDGILNALTRGLEFEPAWPLVRGLIERLAAYMERRGYWNTWRVVLEQAIALSQRVGDIAGETTMTALLARLSQRQSRGQDVVRYYRRVIRLAKRSDNQYELARACSNLGYYYIDASRWWRSEVLSLQALKIFEELDSDHGRAHTHNHLGVLYIRQARFEEAELQLQKARNLWLHANDRQAVIHSSINLASLYVKLNQASDALVLLKEAEKACNSAGDKASLGAVFQTMGSAYRSQNDGTNTIKYVLQSEEIYRAIGNQLALARTQNFLGLLYSADDPNDDAMSYFSEALTGFRKLKSVDDELNALTNIVLFQLNKHEWQTASTYLEELKATFQLHTFSHTEENLALLEKFDKCLVTRSTKHLSNAELH